MHQQVEDPGEQADEQAGEDDKPQGPVDADAAHDLVGLGNPALGIGPGRHRQQPHHQPAAGPGGKEAGAHARGHRHGEIPEVAPHHQADRGLPGPVGCLRCWWGRRLDRQAAPADRRDQPSEHQHDTDDNDPHGRSMTSPTVPGGLAIRPVGPGGRAAYRALGFCRRSAEAVRTGAYGPGSTRTPGSAGILLSRVDGAQAHDLGRIWMNPTRLKTARSAVRSRPCPPGSFWPPAVDDAQHLRSQGEGPAALGCLGLGRGRFAVHQGPGTPYGVRDRTEPQIHSRSREPQLCDDPRAELNPRPDGTPSMPRNKAVPNR